VKATKDAQLTNRRVRIAAVAVGAMLLAAVLAGGCASKQSASGTPPTGDVTVTTKDNGSSVSMAVGKQLKAQLDSNPSTGYSWVATHTPDFLLQQGEPVFSQADSGGKVGAGGTQTFTYKARSGGEAELVLVYVRPWETGVAPAQTFSVKITAK
jgi:inhibitor of cysteine peptidase